MTVGDRSKLLLFFFAAACGAAPAPPSSDIAPLAADGLRPAIVKGESSDEGQNAVVLVIHFDALVGGGGAATGCSGTLLTPTLVLTARHCVADTDLGAVCNSKGEPLAGGAVTKDHAPRAIYVFGGKDRPDPHGGTAARGTEILTTGATTICNGDIALVLLDRPVAGATIAPVRLDAQPERGEPVTVVGWGITEQDPNPATRRQRTGIPIHRVGPALRLGPAEFEIGEGTCDGDSGGPALSASGAVLGALSRGGNGSMSPGVEGCFDASNVFTSASAYADFIRSGYARAGQEPWLEGTPNPLLAKDGVACAADADCQSALCDAARKTCAKDCAISACGGGERCIRQDQRSLCAPDTSEEEGCAASAPGPRSDRFPPTASLFTLAVIFAWARRKKVESGRTPASDQAEPEEKT